MSKSSLRWVAIAFFELLVLFQTLSTLTPVVAQSASRYFPETDHTISGKFLEYWEQNGGLPVFGYPITDAQFELNKDDGKTYLTQWFERNRLELHPENKGTAYEVQLGLLGKAIKQEALTADPDFQPAEVWDNPALPAEEERYFAATGHNLGGRFLAYWLENGGLEHFGYPLNEAHPEVSLEDGQVYLTPSVTT